MAAPSTVSVDSANRPWATVAAITRVSTMGEDCSAIVTRRAGQRSRNEREPMAAPSTSAKARVAASAPAIRTSE